ncbi:helicase [Myxococcus sp. CA051A]|uniref:helicase-related protein n=1 Tax=unclassified Myxococcus TaxID=2648731 RepID=UPI00157A3D95|nr:MULTISPECIES: helicase-related protein [unclassified Myxococcus]NTX40952.1 helicase [Myxococcus sp. CA033]NTX54545.1 helicase [Myxococcus sp. CA039A]NTX67311.1 helicase [Myxococcus sp. CA051A]
MNSSPSSRSAIVVAELGPTNTGKTHRAIERMLEHDTGMMGLPLRLLAREVYDRVTARVGEGRVALMTGEEKRLPPRPDYWICTVEAMPLDRTVDFLAVDEIQLAAHRERGHVFTDRLLHARGRKETWFLGADTMRPMLQSLIPHASVKRATRLSQLRYSGRRSLKSLPPRSAVVAFSADRVYELAESLRRLRGGVAVVLGALSPRTRNAQVAMYQSGEVQYLVATDAIGMGLNLDLNHVAFAALSKYDGAEQRDLFSDELAQIAGRAGRHLNDGSFGTLNTLSELSPRVVSSIESHQFPAVRSLIWRNAELDFASPEALLDSLTRAPRHNAFIRVERADDFDALKDLSQVPAVRDLVTDRAGVELLWQVCQIPDFRKGLFGQHVGLLRETFLQLAEGDGTLDATWLGKQVSPLDDVSGDLHTLMDRLAAIRIWTYISHRSSWLHDAEQWQERTRHIEDALGDALHERLVERFVQRAARRSARRFVRATAPVAGSGSDSPFAKLGLLLGEVAGADGPALTEEQFVQRVVDATHEAFEVDALGSISFEGQPLARLVRGTDRRSPQLALAEPEVWTGGARRRLERRLNALARDLVTEAMGGFPAESLTGAGRSAVTRGLSYRLAEGVGVITQGEAREQWGLMDEESRERLRTLGVREGRRYFYVANALSPPAMERRCMLTALFLQKPAPKGVPSEVSLEASVFGAREARAFGYEVLGSAALRIDVVERLADALRHPNGAQQAQALMQELRLEAGARAVVLRELGGPSGSAAMKRRRRRRRGTQNSPAVQQAAGSHPSSRESGTGARGARGGPKPE